MVEAARGFGAKAAGTGEAVGRLLPNWIRNQPRSGQGNHHSRAAGGGVPPARWLESDSGRIILETALPAVRLQNLTAVSE